MRAFVTKKQKLMNTAPSSLVTRGDKGTGWQRRSGVRHAVMEGELTLAGGTALQPVDDVFAHLNLCDLLSKVAPMHFNFYNGVCRKLS